MSIETDIQKIKDNTALLYDGYPEPTIIREQIEALKLYREAKLIPGIQSAIKGYSDGGSFSSDRDQRVIAIRVELGNLNALLVSASLPNDTDF